MQLRVINGNDTIGKVGTSITEIQSELVVDSTGNNITIGRGSTSGQGNVAVGTNALESNTTGQLNTAVGTSTLQRQTGSYNNSTFGQNTLANSDSGTNNTGLGTQSLENLTKGTNNVTTAYLSGNGVTTSHGNILIGLVSGKILTTGYHNTIVRNKANAYADDCSESIILGARITNTTSNELYVTPKIKTFNISGLTASLGSGTGKILEYNSKGLILPSSGTHNTVAKIDSAFSAILATPTPGYFWFDKPVLPSISGDKISWSINTRASSNLSNTSVWTCTATGIWQFNFQIYIGSYSGHPMYRIYKNGSKLITCEQRASSSKSTASIINFAMPAKNGNTFYCTLLWSSSKP